MAQGLKTLIDFALNKSFNKERLVGSGGMPSSHSATVCGLTTAAVIKYGVGSFEFAISFVLSMIVMYDAIGVRRETGKQAKLLNSILMEKPVKAQRRGAAGAAEGVCGPYALAGCGRGYFRRAAGSVGGHILLDFM